MVSPAQPRRTKTRRSAGKAVVSKEARRTLRYVEPLNDGRTSLAGVFSILIGLGCCTGLLAGPWTGLSTALVQEADAASVDVWYGPEDEPLNRVVQIYEEANRYIYVAVYGMTSFPAAKALIAAHKRGVDVRVITDRERMKDRKQRAAVSALREAGIPVMVNRHDSLMHLKQVVVDDEVNASGSMNHTTSGNRYNDERLDVIRDHAISVKAREKFLSMWKDQERFREWK